jgi:hypothetical protein
MGRVQMEMNKMTEWKKVIACDNVKRSMVTQYENAWGKIK